MFPCKTLAKPDRGEAMPPTNLARSSCFEGRLASSLSVSPVKIRASEYPCRIFMVSWLFANANTAFKGARKSSFANTPATSPSSFFALISIFFSFNAISSKVFFATCSFAPAFLNTDLKADRSFTLMPLKSKKKKP